MSWNVPGDLVTDKVGSATLDSNLISQLLNYSPRQLRVCPSANAIIFCINVIFIFLVFPRLALGLHLHHLFTGWSDLCLVFYNKTACLRLNYNKMVTFLPLKSPVKHYCLIILMCVVKLPHGFIGPCIPNLLLTISLHSLEIHDEA